MEAGPLNHSDGLDQFVSPVGRVRVEQAQPFDARYPAEAAQERVCGQDEAVRAVSEAIRRSRAMFRAMA